MDQVLLIFSCAKHSIVFMLRCVTGGQRCVETSVYLGGVKILSHSRLLREVPAS
jgi:hypothetical protein